MSQPHRSRTGNRKLYPCMSYSGQGLIARNGHIAQAFRYACVSRLRFYDPLGRPLDMPRWFAIQEAQRTRYALFDCTGKKCTEFAYDEIVAAGEYILCLGKPKSSIYDARSGALLFSAPYRVIQVSEHMFSAMMPTQPNEKALMYYRKTGSKLAPPRGLIGGTMPDFHSGFALLFDGQNAVYMDKSGRVALSNQFYYIGSGNYGDVYPFNHAGCAAGRVRGKTGRFGIIDKKGAFVLPPEALRIRQLMDGRFAVTTDKGIAIYAANGRSQTPPIYTDVQQEDFGMLSARGVNEHYDFLDQNGKPIPLPPDISPGAQIDPVSRDCFQVRIPLGDERWQTGLIQLKGEWLLPPMDYVHLRPLCVYQRKPYYIGELNSGLVQLLDGAGDSVTPPLVSLQYLDDDLCQIQTEDQMQLIDLSGNTVWKARPPVSVETSNDA